MHVFEIHGCIYPHAQIAIKMLRSILLAAAVQPIKSLSVNHVTQLTLRQTTNVYDNFTFGSKSRSNQHICFIWQFKTYLYWSEKYNCTTLKNTKEIPPSDSTNTNRTTLNRKC